jgi:hypothetical protein
MQVENASLGKVCASCGRNNANALKFCLTCGQQFSQDSVQVYGPDMFSPSFCKRCGIDDPYNEKFCIACGDDLPVPAPAQVAAPKGESMSQSRTNIPRTRTPSPSQPIAGSQQKSGIASGALFPLLTACGAALGVLGAYMLNEHQLLEYAANRVLWPHSGLVIYVKPSSCEATVSTLDKKRVLLARADRHGNVNFDSLTDGDYRLTLTAPGYETVGQIVKVSADRPTILGYPDPVTLPNRSTQP